MKESNTPPEPRGLVRWLARRIVQRYYPLVEITNAERIPQSCPVLLCANHGNSLIDAVMIGIAARRPVRFMAKAPLFDIPVLGRLMKAVGMIPAFRSTPSLWGRRQSGIDAARGWSSEVTSCGRSDLKAGAK